MTSGDFDEQAGRLFENLGILDQKLEVAESSVKAHSENRRELVGEIETFRRQLRTGNIQLSDEVKDYTLVHHGAEGPNNVEGVRAFLSELQHYKGQLILEEQAGFTSTSTAIGVDPSHIDSRFLYGRLNEETPYEISMPHRHLNASTNELQIWTPSEGWKSCNQNIPLGEFLEVCLTNQTPSLVDGRW